MPGPEERQVTALAIVAGSLAALLTVRLGSEPTQSAAAWSVIAALFVLVELVPVHFEHRNQAHSVSLSAIPLVVGLFVLSPLALIAARLTAVTVCNGAIRRQVPVKMLLNLSSFWLADVVAILVFRSLLIDDHGLWSWPAAFAAVLAADQVQGLMVTVAISLYERRVELLPEMFWLGPSMSLVNAGVGVLAVTLLRAEPAALGLVCLAAPFLHISHRAHARLREKHRELDQLYQFSCRITAAVTDRNVSATLLGEVQELMKAEQAWLCVDDTPNAMLRIRAQDGVADSIIMPPSSIDGRLHDLAQVACGPVLVDDHHVTGLADIGVRQALIAPLPHVGACAATLVVANRRGDVRDFDDDDLRLFATLVSHASSTLENDHLLDQLRLQAEQSEHESLHDPLTGLANRSYFRQRLSQTLSAGDPLAVLLLDLDGFKDVNDTLGHHFGDVLLESIASRLRSHVRAGDMVARLGGDEFAVLATGIDDADVAASIGRSLLEAIEAPVELGPLLTTVRASVGVALAPSHGTDPASLLRCADVAMYVAKSDRTSIEVYEANRDDSSTDRLVLAGLLREAIGADGIDVHFQPQLDLRTGTVSGAEALLRWGGREDIDVGTEELIAVAEHAGLMRPLTRRVLALALGECRRWWDAGRCLTVSVNLSAQNMLDEGFVDDVLEAVAASGLPTHALRLEITETTAMANPERSTAVLHRLHEAGIGLSVDDFGTGYSSLAYLSQLPVDEVKIDKSFVLGMDTDPGRDIIVESIIGLGRSLGLTVVAEGIETEASKSRLTGLGCDLGQGYLFSRPVPRDAFAAWLTGVDCADDRGSSSGQDPVSRALLRTVS